MRRTRLRCAGIDIKTGLTNLAASNLRETPGALPVISRAAHYAGEGYSFMDTMLTLGPRAALGFLRTRASAYMVFCTAAFLGVSYFMTTDRVRLRSSELIVPLRMKSQSADQSVVKRNRITGAETVIEAVDGPHGETVYFRAHVNRLLYTYHVYKPKKEEYLLIDIGGELAADRFCDVEHKRGRVHEERALSEAMARGAKMHKTLPVEAPVRGRREMLHPAADVAPQSSSSSSSSSSSAATQLSEGATIGVKYSARIERMPGGDLGHLFTVREVMTNAIKETMVEGYRQCIYKKYRHGVPTSSSSSVATSSSSAGLPVVHPVLVDLHMGQGTWDGQGITAVDVLHHVTGTTDTTAALRNLEEIVLQKATNKMGHFAILSDLHMTLRGGA
ncbi:transmembrane protein, putative [Bodo saltans]|uniref:Transmembrane protein, putative n=1 Tax=Bodo saltans TaxID=75058 RepID=A0A0S4JHG7_BODSA|nr:transmembrane protein, putative [Bodo saltans]|eukprot:CUG89789.1 transmembrane protein, putative [Bodo saltans]